MMRATITIPSLLLTAALMFGAQAQAADLDNGHALFQRWCAGCHAGTNRQGGLPAGTYTLQQRYQGRLPADLEKRTDLQPAYIKTLVRSGINIMPRTRKTEITDAELDDLVAYLTQNNR